VVLHRRVWLVCVVGWIVFAASCAGTQGARYARRSAAFSKERSAWAAQGSTRTVARAAPKAVQPGPPVSQFTFPPGLRAEVEFWKNIFARYSKLQVVIHDPAQLDRVYSVLDFRHLAQGGTSQAQIDRQVARAVKREKERIAAVLNRLHKRGGRASTAEERRIADMFRSSTSSRKFQRAASSDRLRSQPGLRERFARGIEVGHRYFPDMERMFREEGVPTEITRLPLVESSFNVDAYSRRRAAGIWQFIPSTGRLFMRIDPVIDERRDPLISSRAAARFLRQNYDKLGTWPLAINAYNHGPAGMARAVRKTGTRDITTIINNYSSRTFKFASRNFYPEFLAALEVEQKHQHYFGPLKLQAPVPFDVVRPAHFIDLDALARCAGVSTDAVVELNRQFSRDLRAGKQRIPKGYATRLPAGTSSAFHQRYATLPANYKFHEQKQLYVVHRVRHGQTLASIARRYGNSVERIRSYNGIRNKHMIRAGQRLRIPTGGSNFKSTKPSYVVHRVRRGQTLALIARRYGSSVERIRSYNGLRNKHMIRVGQRLRIPVS